MSEKMKLSDFLVERQVKFNLDGSFEIVEPVINKSFVLHNLDMDMLKRIENIKSDEYFLYEVVDIFTDIEKDIPKEKFQDMMTLPPNDYFCNFIDQMYKLLTDTCEKVYKRKEDAKRMQKEVDDLTNKLPEDVQEKVKNEIKVEN